MHLRRKQFFDAWQKEGQSIIEFWDELLSLIDEADGVTITINGLVCMMLQIGASDTALQKELDAIQNPTLPAFNRAIEGYEQARKTTATSAHGNAASMPSPFCIVSLPRITLDNHFPSFPPPWKG